MRESFAQAGLPVVSVDSKHRELVGDFKNPGATWEEEPILVNDHDFPSQAKGVALPYGVYDVAANHACVSVGTTHDTRTSQSTTWPGGGPATGAATTRRHRTARARRLRWQQRGTHPGLEVRPPAPPVRPARPHGHRLPLPERRLEVEPH